MKRLINQSFKFGIVGVIAFIIDYSILYILTSWFQVYYLVSATISFIVSLIFNYILSIKWVFDVNKKQTVKDVIIFTVLSVIGLIINYICMYLSVDMFNIHYMIGKLVATFIVMIWNFVTRKIFLENKNSNEIVTKTKRKLLFTAYDLNIGGIEMALINLLNRIDYDKYEVTVVLEKKEGPLLAKVNKNVLVKNYNLSYNKNIIFRKTINLTKRIIYLLGNKNSYDFSCCYATYSGIGEKIAKISSKNNSIYVHSDYTLIYPKDSDFYQFFNKRKIQNFRKVIFVSNESKDKFLKKYPDLKSKSIVINNFVDEDKIISLSQAKIKEKKKEEKLLVFVGRLTEESKKLSRALELINRLKNKYSIELWIVGDGEDKNRYEKIVKEKNLEKNVKFLGMKKNPFPYMKKANYILLTSDYEGFPVIYMESAILNKKIITTMDVSDQFISIKNKLGYIISKDINEMEKQIDNIFKYDNLKYKKIDIKEMNNQKIRMLENIFDEVI